MNKNDQIIFDLLKEIFEYGLDSHPEWKPLIDNWDNMVDQFNTDEEWENIQWPDDLTEEGIKNISNFCNNLYDGNVNFDVIFGCLASREENSRTVFMGLVDWIQSSDRPTILGRYDLVLHFIFGGAIESVSGLGELAGVLKEKLDAMGFGVSDITDQRATETGALFANILDKNKDLRNRLSRLDPSISIFLKDFEKWKKELEKMLQE